MSNGLKIFLWVVAILVGLAVIAFLVWKVWAEKKINEIWDNITFSKPKVESIDLKGATLTDLQNALLSGKPVDIILTLGMDIQNKNNFDIPFSVKIKSSYKGMPIAETSSISGTVPANNAFYDSSPVAITLSGAQVQILIEKLKGKKSTIDYSIDLSLFGIPINRFIGPITNTFEI